MIYYFQIIAITCIFLAAKIEESPRRLTDIITVYFLTRFQRKKEDISEVVCFLVPIFIGINYFA